MEPLANAAMLFVLARFAKSERSQFNSKRGGDGLPQGIAGDSTIQTSRPRRYAAARRTVPLSPRARHCGWILRGIGSFFPSRASFWQRPPSPFRALPQSHAMDGSSNRFRARRYLARHLGPGPRM